MDCSSRATGIVVCLDLCLAKGHRGRVHWAVPRRRSGMPVAHEDANSAAVRDELARETCCRLAGAMGAAGGLPRAAVAGSSAVGPPAREPAGRIPTIPRSDAREQGQAVVSVWRL